MPASSSLQSCAIFSICLHSETNGPQWPCKEDPLEDMIVVNVWTSKRLESELVRKFQGPHDRQFDIESHLAVDFCNDFIRAMHLLEVAHRLTKGWQYCFFNSKL